MSSATHRDLSSAVRFLAADAIEKAKSGHPGMALGMADVATVLFQHFLSFNPDDPRWPNRDRFLLSAGHGSMLQYALLHLTGYSALSLTQLQQFRQLGSRAPGHPEYDITAGIETTTGPLGQGLGNAVGMALNERFMRTTFGTDLINYFVYTIVGDGCLMEGISQEAISFAGHHKLGHLIVLFDDNGISIDGNTSLATSDDTLQRFEASNWQTIAIDGHDPQAIKTAIEEAKEDPRPSLIACKTTIGYGAPKKAGTEKCHGSPLGADEMKSMREKLEWPHDPFDIPANILSAWWEIGRQHSGEYNLWQATLAKKTADTRHAFTQRMNNQLPSQWRETFHSLLHSEHPTPPDVSTRIASQEAINFLTQIIPELVGGSADLTRSNNTKGNEMTVNSNLKPRGNYIHFGVREHAMGSIMNGLALAGGIIPYGGTFLVFSDYCRPAIRLAALMKIRVIYVMTHDSIGVGEDGPTHQPIEHLMSLRLIPNLTVLRPADLVETAEAWEVALDNKDGPSLLALTRQTLPALSTWREENLTKRGGYILRPAVGTQDVTLIATGSEVSVAVETQELLKALGINAAVVSMPSTTLFDQQDPTYRAKVLGGKDILKVAIEAGSPRGWEVYTGPEGFTVGIEAFGISAPAKSVFEHFGLTPEKITQRIHKKLKEKS